MEYILKGLPADFLYGQKEKGEPFSSVVLAHLRMPLTFPCCSVSCVTLPGYSRSKLVKLLVSSLLSCGNGGSIWSSTFWRDDMD
jgi:hypothetical protein